MLNVFSLLFSPVILLAFRPSHWPSVAEVAESHHCHHHRVRNQCRKCFTRRLCGSETAFGSRGTWGRGRFRGSQTDRFLLYHPLSPDRSPCFERHTSIPDPSDWSDCQQESFTLHWPHFPVLRVWWRKLLTFKNRMNTDEKPCQRRKSCTQCSTRPCNVTYLPVTKNSAYKISWIITVYSMVI